MACATDVMTDRKPNRLTSRPATPSAAEYGPGLHKLGLSIGRDAWLIVPQSHRSGAALPLAVMLHGAGGNAQRSGASLQSFADEGKIAVLIPESRDVTWDAIRAGFGADVEFVDTALGHVFDRFTIDRSHLAIGGFSDGATYALSLGIPNGDLFTHVIAYSPGFLAATTQAGRPRIFVSHGTRDQILPIENCSRRLVPALREAGYRVHYKEFDGGHTVPGEIAQEALDWFLKS